jgi:hypothetical protein
MNRLQIIVLDRKNGIIPHESIDIPSLMSFLLRTGRARSLQVLATIGKRSLFIERLDMTTLHKQLNDFQTATT